jgi:hypothetical protein
MRLVDLVVRQGHLSERALTEAVMTGDRPAHLDICDICNDRAEALTRWLDQVAANASAAADSAFPVERLAAQHAQVLRRLEQIDEPPRVIAFPNHGRSPQRESEGRRIAPAWLGVAAAAGLVIGLVGGQASVRLEPASTQNATSTVIVPGATETDPVSVTPADASRWMEMDLDVTPAPLRNFDDWTPPAIGTLAVMQAGG